MNKGYALSFLIILLVVLIGLYVAFTGFMSTREALRAQATPAPTGGVSQATRMPTPTAPTATLLVIPTPLPAITATTVESSDLPAATEPPPPDEVSEPSPEPPPEPSPTRAQAPAPTPAPAFQFRVLSARPDPNRGSCCYIFGSVRDAKGNLLENVLVQAWNQWNRLPPAATKVGAEAGQYNIPIGSDKVTWYVIVVDAAGNQLSSQAVVEFDVGVAGQYQVDWQRTY